MRALTRLIRRHWRGDLPPAVAVLGVLPACCAAMGLLHGMAEGSPALARALLLPDLALLTWALTGAFRASDRAIAETGNVLRGWGGYAVVALAAALTAGRVFGALMPAWQPEDLIAAPPPGLTLDAETRSARIEGEITLRIYTALAALPPPRKLTIDSPGGNVFAARGIARLVAEGGTAVTVRSTCASACTLIFLAADTRELRGAARLGFHGYRVGSHAGHPDHKFLDPTAEMARDAAFFRARGVSAEFTDRAFATDPPGIWFPDRAELVAAGILPG